MRDGSLDFSFSGLKTAALRLVESGQVRPARPGEDPAAVPGLLEVLAGFQEAVVEQLLDRAAARWRRPAPSPRASPSAAGLGQFALRERAAEFSAERGVPVWVPSPRFSTDNAVMVASLGEARLSAGDADGPGLFAEASIPLGEEQG